MSVRHDLTAESLEESSFRPIHAGDDYDYKFIWTYNSLPLDLTAAKLWLTVKERTSQPDSEARLQLISTDTSQIEITDAAGGEFTVKFRGSTTGDLEGLFIYDIQVKMGGGSVITLAHGKIEFLENITRATA